MHKITFSNGLFLVKINAINLITTNINGNKMYINTNNMIQHIWKYRLAVVSTCLLFKLTT